MLDVSTAMGANELWCRIGDQGLYAVVDGGEERAATQAQSQMLNRTVNVHDAIGQLGDLGKFNGYI